MTIPANTVCHRLLIYSCINPRMNIKFVELCIYLSCTPHIALTLDLCPLEHSHITFIQAPCFSSIQYCRTYVTHIISPYQFWRKSTIQQLSTLPKLNPLNFVLAVTAVSHPPRALGLSPRYVNSLSVSTSSHNFPFCSTASQILTSHFLHVKFLGNVGVTLFILTHLP